MTYKFYYYYSTASSFSVNEIYKETILKYGLEKYIHCVSYDDVRRKYKTKNEIHKYIPQAVERIPAIVVMDESDDIDIYYITNIKPFIHATFSHIIDGYESETESSRSMQSYGTHEAQSRHSSRALIPHQDKDSDIAQLLQIHADEMDDGRVSMDAISDDIFKEFANKDGKIIAKDGKGK